ncbi:MAG: DUF480 domain-containing protein [Planctomycetaceae bacterium]|nr:DUF480 domain-containing protein [Planctomycetaceae bacterium]
MDIEHAVPTAAPQVEAPDDKPLVRTLSKPQRRVLGVLVEKGLTTPDQYPLTLKSLTSGCNQKSNRDPVTNYSEDAVEEAMDELRQLGLAAVVHTESGRTERYRHFMRQRYPFTETQLAIMTELLLRGRQQLGELRSRASRMVPIDSLEQLRADLQDLMEQGFVRTNGPLERRGIEVDHAMYEPQEKQGFDSQTSPLSDEPVETRPVATTATSVVATAPAADDGELAALKEECRELRAQLQETTQQVESLSEQVRLLSDDISDLRRDLGA